MDLVPTLEDKDLVLWESNTIVRYLVAQYGEVDAPYRRCRCESKSGKVDGLGDVHARHPFRDVFWNVVRLTPDKQDHAAKEKGIQDCSKLFAIVDAALASAALSVGLKNSAWAIFPLAALPMPGWKCLSSGRIIPHLVYVV